MRVPIPKPHPGAEALRTADAFGPHTAHRAPGAWAAPRGTDPLGGTREARGSPRLCQAGSPHPTCYDVESGFPD